MSAQRSTYVDDVVALTVGPAQTLRAMHMLLVASRAAGLEIECHSCRILVLRNPGDETRQRLAGLRSWGWILTTAVLFPCHAGL